MNRDAIVVGGGLVGPLVALGLAQAGLRVAVCDAQAAEVRADPEFDGRAYSVADASRIALKGLGVWDRVAVHAQPVNRIVISDGRLGGGPGEKLAEFDHAELDTGPGSWMVEDRWLRPAILAALAEAPGIDHLAPVEVVDTGTEGDRAVARLADGRVLRAPVLVASDGRDSPVAARAGIRRDERAYDQTGLVCSVTHEKPHGGTAWQHFLPAGPLAILPLPGNACSLVWTERGEVARRVAALPDAEYLAEVRRRMGDVLGAVALAGRRWSYPLRLSLARRFAADRLALAGDAAHAVHPIAGQGFNLGVRDAAALIEVLADAARRGEDTGSPLVLERYERWRRFDTASLAWGFDALNRLFSNDDPILRALRGAGAAAAGRFGPARRMFMREAAGLSGDLPRLMRGRPV